MGRVALPRAGEAADHVPHALNRRMPDALFERDGARFVPTELCRGPWSPDAQHGGPPAVLLARAAEGL